MQAILTKNLPWTNTKPSRIKAFCSGGNITISKSSIPNMPGGDEMEHKFVAKKLAEKLNWGPVHLASGSTKEGYAFVVITPGEYK